jgi:hypothetical protein
LLGFEASVEEVISPLNSVTQENEIFFFLVESDFFGTKGARVRHLTALFYSQADRLALAHLLSHYDKIKHKLGSVPLQILQLDVLKF